MYTNTKVSTPIVTVQAANAITKMWKFDATVNADAARTLESNEISLVSGGEAVTGTR
jgi:hypothetical protein